LLFKAESKTYEEDRDLAPVRGDKGNCSETTEQEVSFLRSGMERYEKQKGTVVNHGVMASCYSVGCSGKTSGRRIVLCVTYAL